MQKSCRTAGRIEWTEFPGFTPAGSTFEQTTEPKIQFIEDSKGTEKNKESDSSGPDSLMTAILRARNRYNEPGKSGTVFDFPRGPFV